MAHIHFKRDVHVDPSVRAAVEQSFALLSEEYSVSISLREGTDDWSVQVVGPATVVAGGIPIHNHKPEAITKDVRQKIRGLHRGRGSVARGHSPRHSPRPRARRGVGPH